MLALRSVRAQLGVIKGQGNTTVALRELRENFKQITVDDLEESPADSSCQYWLHMRKKGLVDILLRDSGIQVP